MAAPTITITSVMPGTSISANTGTVEIHWSVSDAPPDAATAIYLGSESPGAEVLEDGTFTDIGGWTSGVNILPTTSGTSVETYERTGSLLIIASNDDGQTEGREMFYSKIRVGYHDATVPGAPVYRSELTRIQNYLESLETRLRSNVLEGLPDYILEWNSTVPPDSHFPDFDDMDYLSAAVGAGGLADDILNAMESVLVYIHAYTMPRGYRPETTSPDQHHLCEEVLRDDGETSVVYGISTRQWVAICIDTDADSLTLLHELFHHASTSNNHSEARAFAISMCAFGIGV